MLIISRFYVFKKIKKNLHFKLVSYIVNKVSQSDCHLMSMGSCRNKIRKDFSPPHFIFVSFFSSMCAATFSLSIDACSIGNFFACSIVTSDIVLRPRSYCGWLSTNHMYAGSGVAESKSLELAKSISHL